MSKVAVTGAGGFVGAYLVRRLIAEGHAVVAVDNYLRGRPERLVGIEGPLQLVNADVRDSAVMAQAFEGCQAVFHLAAVNGTENFYNHPDLVLDVGVRGMLAVIDGVTAANVPDLIVASSAEVYQTPSIVPTDESVPLVLPNTTNPRYSYGGSKLISELLAFNYCRGKLDKVQVFRPHNVYGPDMGWKHVLPQLIAKVQATTVARRAEIELQGDGHETRAFCYVDDIVSGIVTMWNHGETMNIYHIGSIEEVPIRHLAELVGEAMGVELSIKTGPAPEGGTPRRCPDIGKMRCLGYNPAVSLREGVARTVKWYLEHPADTDNPLL